MRVELYGIYDTVSKQYFMLFTAKNALTATRQFKESVIAKQFGPATEDLALMKLGFFDQETGEIFHSKENIFEVEKAKNLIPQKEDK